MLKKKIISLFLTMAMVLSLLPTNIFAGAPPSNPDPDVELFIQELFDLNDQEKTQLIELIELFDEIGQDGREQFVQAFDAFLAPLTPGQVDRLERYGFTYEMVSKLVEYIEGDPALATLDNFIDYIQDENHDAMYDALTRREQTFLQEISITAQDGIENLQERMSKVFEYVRKVNDLEIFLFVQENGYLKIIQDKLDAIIDLGNAMVQNTVEDKDSLIDAANDFTSAFNDLKDIDSTAYEKVIDYLYSYSFIANIRYDYSPTTVTNGDVTVTLSLRNDNPDYTVYYMLGTSPDWEEYTAPFAVPQNMEIHAKLEENTGTEIIELLQISFSISNIDKRIPNQPTISISPTTNTVDPVTVTITGDANVTLYYSLDNVKWIEYVNPFTVSDNTTVYAKAINDIENESTVAQKAITNIITDTEGPSISVSNNSIQDGQIIATPNTLLAKFTATDTTGVDKFYYKNEKLVNGQVSSTTTGTVDLLQQLYSIPEVSAVGIYRLSVWATDTLGNISNVQSYNYKIVDGAVPSATVVLTSKNQNSQSGYSDSETVAIAVNTVNATTLYISNTNDFINASPIQIQNNSYTGDWTLATVASGQVADKTVYIKVTSQANTPYEASASIKVDKQAPVVGTITHTATNNQTAGSIIYFNTTVTNAGEEIKSAKITLYNSNNNEVITDKTMEVYYGGNLSYAYVVPINAAFTITKAKVSVVDKAGNSTNKEENITINFPGSLALTFKDGASANVNNLNITLTNDTNTVSRSATISDTNTYTFANLPVGTYTVSWSPLSSNSLYLSGSENNILVNSGVATNKQITVAKKPTGTVNFTVKEEGTTNAISQVAIYLYSTNGTYYATEYTDNAGAASFTNMPLSSTSKGEFSYYTSIGSYAQKYGKVTFDSAGTKNVDITLPQDKYIIGYVYGANNTPLQNVDVWASYYDSNTWDYSWAYTKTDSTGKYTLRGLKDTVTYNVGVYSNVASDGKKYLALSKTGLGAKDQAGSFDNSYNFNLQEAYKISGTVTKLSNPTQPAASVYVSAEPINQSYNSATGEYPTWGWAMTGADGKYTMDGLRPGQYKIKVQYVTDYNDYEETVTVGSSAIFTKDINLSPKGADKAFYGTENKLTVDKDYVAPNGTITYKVNYMNKNVITLSGTKISVALPEGFAFVGTASSGVTHNANTNTVEKTIATLAPSATGSFSFSVKADADKVKEGQTYSTSATATWTKAGRPITEAFGVDTVEVLSVTLNGPDRTATNKIKIYGEASPDADIYIYKVGQDAPLLVTRAIGRYWSGEITLPLEGTYTLFAKSSINGEISRATSSLTVKYNQDLINVSKARVTAGWNGVVETDPRLGVVTLGVSQGQTMKVKIQLTKPANIDVDSNGVSFIFNDQSYQAVENNGWYEQSITIGYNISGTKLLKAVFTDTNAISETYNIPIANIVILVDPSGYVYDAVEGEDTRIQGITMLNEVYDENTTTWSSWDANNYGQVNPQTSDETGRYGWEVPGGPSKNDPIYYRVSATDPSGQYAPYCTDMEGKWVDDNNGIAVPPPRLDVNIGLVDQSNTSITVKSPANKENNVALTKVITMTFNKKLDPATITANNISVFDITANQAVAGSLAYDDATKTVTFTPTSALEDSSKYQVTVKAAITSKHGLTSNDAAYQTYLNKYNKSMTADSVWTFNTAVVTPAVSTINPASAATGVSASSPIVVTFNKNMNATTMVANNIKLKEAVAGTEVAVNLNYNAVTRQLTITPTAALKYSTQYKVEIKNVADTKAQVMGDYSSTFTTRSAPSSGGGGGFVTPIIDSDTIPSGGGSIELLDDITVVAPSGAFDSNTILTVEQMDKDEEEVPEDTNTSSYTLGSYIYEFTSNKDLNKPLQITLPYDQNDVSNESKLGIYYYNEDTQTWDYVGGKVDEQNNTVTVSIDQLGKYAVMQYDKTFIDIPGHWAQGNIELLAARFVINGMTEETFEPEGNITRAQFAVAMVRALQLDLIPYSGRFQDVPADAWYRDYLETAYQYGLIKGISATEYQGEANINREQLAVMVMRAYSKITGKTIEEIAQGVALDFADSSNISDYAREAAAAAKQLAIVMGMDAGDNTFIFAPQDDSTRAQAVTMILRFLLKSSLM